MSNEGKNFLVEFKTSCDDFSYFVSYDKCDDDCKKAIDSTMQHEQEFYDKTGDGEWDEAMIELPAMIHHSICVIESF